jgi:tellurite resistance protein TerC
MRGGMIAAGWLLLERFHWIIYVFGAFLVISGIRMATHDDIDIEPEANPLIRMIRRVMPISKGYQGDRFFVRTTVEEKLNWMATPLLVVLIMVETTDLVFAIDSIPAIFAITRDPFIVFTSNVFAILCLRSMYFLLAGVIDKFHFLKLGLAFVLVFVGCKMLVTYFDIHVAVAISLGVVGFFLGASIVASLLFPKRAAKRTPIHPETPPPDIPD